MNQTIIIYVVWCVIVYHSSFGFCIGTHHGLPCLFAHAQKSWIQPTPPLHTLAIWAHIDVWLHHWLVCAALTGCRQYESHTYAAAACVCVSMCVFVLLSESHTCELQCVLYGVVLYSLTRGSTWSDLSWTELTLKAQISCYSQGQVSVHRNETRGGDDLRGIEIVKIK